jgi:hypothetical protein
MDSDCSAKHRDVVEGLRKCDVSHAVRLAHVVAHDGQRFEIAIVKTESFDGLCQTVLQGGMRRHASGRPTGSVEYPERARIWVQPRAPTPAGSRLLLQLGEGCDGALDRRPKFTDIEVGTRRPKPFWWLLPSGHLTGNRRQRGGDENEAEPGTRRHDGAPPE